MFNNVKRAARIIVDFATVYATLCVAFGLSLNPLLVGGALIGLAGAGILSLIIVIENKNNQNKPPNQNL